MTSAEASRTISSNHARLLTTRAGPPADAPQPPQRRWTIRREIRCSPADDSSARRSGDARRRDPAAPPPHMTCKHSINWLVIHTRCNFNRFRYGVRNISLRIVHAKLTWTFSLENTCTYIISCCTLSSFIACNREIPTFYIAQKLITTRYKPIISTCSCQIFEDNRSFNIDNQSIERIFGLTLYK